MEARYIVRVTGAFETGEPVYYVPGGLSSKRTAAVRFSSRFAAAWIANAINNNAINRAVYLPGFVARFEPA